MAKLIVIDGLDGQGKATQTALLKQYLEKINNNKVVQLSFPDYDSDSSAAVKMYLSGKLGNDPETLNPYMCSSFYAIDRAIQFVTKFKQYYDDQNTILISDRYLSANIIHQGAKIKDSDARHKFYEWVYKYETELIGIPKEDITLLLSVPVDISQKLMDHRYSGDTSKKDIHEQNVKYLNDCYFAAHDAYKYLKGKGYNWEMIHCENVKGDNIKSVEAIHVEIIQKLKGLRIID